MKNQIIKQFDLKLRENAGKELYDGFMPWLNLYQDGGNIKLDEDWSEETAWRDSWHRRVWINIKDGMIFTFCEGDLTLEVCKDQFDFYNSLFEAANFYKEN